MGKYSFKEGRETAKVLPFAINGEYYYKQGMKAFRHRDLYKAKKYFQRASQLEPKDAIIMCQLAVVLTELGEYQQSNRHLSLCLEADPEMTECYYFLANNYAFLGLFQEAAKYAKMYADLDPYGEFIEDIEDLLDLMNIGADDLEASANDQDELIVMQETARELLEKGEFQEAVSLMKDMIRDYPEFWSAYNNLALAYFYQGEIKKAVDMLHEILEKNPGNLHALCNMLVFMFYQGKQDETKLLVSRLEKVQPILIEHRYKLGATFALVGRYDLAYKWLRLLQKQGFEGDGTFYYWLSWASYKTGRTGLAESSWARVLQYSPEKEGSEPWNEDESDAGSQQEELRGWLDTDNPSERLFRLFLAGGDASFVRSAPFRDAELASPAEKDMRSYILAKNGVAPYANGLKYTEFLYETASVLWSYCGEDPSVTEDLFIAWFGIWERAEDLAVQTSNNKAWAAAAEFVWRKETENPATQKETAAKYGISPATLSKYIKWFKAISE